MSGWAKGEEYTHTTLRNETGMVEMPFPKTNPRGNKMADEQYAEPFKHQDGWGSVFRNNFQEEGKNHPDFTGEGMYEGKMVRFALWQKETKKNAPYFNVHIEPPYAKTEPAPVSTQEALDDDIPF